MNPRMFAGLLFLVLPIAEIFVLIKVGQWIGALPTVFLVVFGAVLGALLIRHQGFMTLTRVRASMERGEVPAEAMLEGAVLFASGILLLVPGFLTDLAGLVALLPPVRRALVRSFLRGPSQPPGPGGGGEPRGPYTIDGEFRRDD